MVTHGALSRQGGGPDAGVYDAGGERRAPLPAVPRSRVADYGWNLLMRGLAWLGIAALIVPTVIVMVTSFDTRSFISFPPEGFSTERFAEMVANEDIRSAALSSLVVAVAAVVLDLIIGVPAAIGLVRREFRGKALLLGFLQTPIMLPGIVIGIALLFFFSALALTLSLPLLVLSHVVITLPFVIRITMARMERADVRVEEAAANLGATKWQVFRLIQLPFLTPGMVAGSGFAFLISFDNLTVSLFTAPVREPTLPIDLFFRMRFDLDPVVSAVATLQILMTLVIFVIGFRMMGEEALVRD